MSFKDIKGLRQPIEMLQIALRQERKAPAYLFIGEDGIGKRLVAKTLAKAINCLKGDGLDSCDQCPSCRKIDNLNHPDVHWILPDSLSNSIKIEQIRQLKNDISLRSYEAGQKVFIIDEAHCLTPEASNAFLKILEEPPPNSLIILITHKPKLIFPTILSRCQKLRFSALKKDQLNEFLLKEFKLDATLSHYLAYFCAGRLGEALNLKDKDILREKNRLIDGFTCRGDIYEEKEFDKQKFREGLNILASWFRDIYFIKTGIAHKELINLDRKNDLLKVMSGYSFLELDALINFISESILYLNQNVNPKLLLSNLKIRLWKG